MAEINIERKKKSMWPWVILLLVIIALIVWALYKMTDDTSETDYEQTPATGMVSPAPAHLIVHAKTLT